MSNFLLGLKLIWGSSPIDTEKRDIAFKHFSPWLFFSRTGKPNFMFFFIWKKWKMSLTYFTWHVSAKLTRRDKRSFLVSSSNGAFGSRSHKAPLGGERPIFSILNWNRNTRILLIFSQKRPTMKESKCLHFLSILFTTIRYLSSHRSAHENTKPAAATWRVFVNTLIK